MSEPPKVLISYSHDSPAHAARVLQLSDRLRADGVDCMIDRYEPAPPEGWPRWMDRQMRAAQFVLVICTETYLRRARGEEKPGVGRGAAWETADIYSRLFDAAMNNQKFVPCVLDVADEKFILDPLRAFTYYNVGDEAGYTRLYRHLTGQPESEMPPLGALKKLPPLQPLSATPEPTSEPPGLSRLATVVLALLVAAGVVYWTQRPKPVERCSDGRAPEVMGGGSGDLGYCDTVSAVSCRTVAGKGEIAGGCYAGRMLGRWRATDENGRLSWSGGFRGTEGRDGWWEIANGDGRISSGNYLHGMRDGAWNLWVREAGHPMRMAGRYQLGVRDGIWKLFDEQDQLRAERPYQGGQIHGTQRLYCRDGVAIEESFAGDKSTGEIRVFVNGKLKWKTGDPQNDQLIPRNCADVLPR